MTYFEVMHTFVYLVVFFLVLNLEVRHPLFQDWKDMVLFDAVVKGEMVQEVFDDSHEFCD